ncbi:MAG: DEAD/DEAH box helicase, partial [Phycisphaerae bacterium]|nr:DEAD/DEAH box helicase [Phycisphaerae bacterium]
SPPGSARSVRASVFFEYGLAQISPDMPGRFLHTEPPADGEDESAVLMPRDRELERAAITRLWDLGFRPERDGKAESLQVNPERLNMALTTLLAEGWLIRSDSRPVRSPQPLQMSIRSGIDWFELRGDVRYPTERGEEGFGLPDILSAASSSRRFISLGDGSLGILPGTWLEEHRLLTSAGEADGDCLRFAGSQVALLDALLAGEAGADLDKRFREARDRLRRFDGIQEVDAPDSFKGQLRSYQREGLGWLTFLQWLGMGGILADDMGLGKTIQVLAMLDRSRSQPEDADDEQPDRTSLVVAPKSVVFNWLDEAARFTPELRVLHYAGADRAPLRETFSEHDLVVTSYGLLRRDIAELREHPFRFAILDEAQAIKNASSQLAKSARLLQARHRLALTGTPVENHLGDLWSILEFANPGFLGSGRRFSELVRGGVRNPGRVETARQVSQVLRPFILRRTKDQVLTELPPKTEQTIVCEMEPDQRKIYDELRRHYRRTLLDGSESKVAAGRAGGTMAVLEALLRLRQACCHPALIDSGRTDIGSAKLEALMEQLVELISEGHKALVFSQFTSMLKLVRDRLDAEGFVYEYLDGQTRARKAHVQRFQTDPDCPLFLISLKAGGQGLNLTAAQYVFILDPWWNPAVEAQAIDRAHRIGQDRAVTAYRLICQDTIEQRIVELQEHKRQLADAIVGEQENLLRNLTRDDLEVLLG